MSRKESRARFERETDRRLNRFVSITAAGVIAVGGAFELMNYLTTPAGRTVTETVQPRDFQNPSLVAERAEARFGSDPSAFSIRDEASRIAEQYGQLRVGEQVKVHVK